MQTAENIDETQAIAHVAELLAMPVEVGLDAPAQRTPCIERPSIPPRAGTVSAIEAIIRGRSDCGCAHDRDDAPALRARIAEMRAELSSVYDRLNELRGVANAAAQAERLASRFDRFAADLRLHNTGKPPIDAAPGVRELAAQHYESVSAAFREIGDAMRNPSKYPLPPESTRGAYARRR